MDKVDGGLREMTKGRTAKIQQNPLLWRLCLPGSGGCQPLLAVSFNQRVVGSIPTALTIKSKLNQRLDRSQNLSLIQRKLFVGTILGTFVVHRPTTRWIWRPHWLSGRGAKRGGCTIGDGRA